MFRLALSGWLVGFLVLPASWWLVWAVAGPVIGALALLLWLIPRPGR